MSISKEDALASICRFLREYGRYPTKLEYREIDYLYSRNTYTRKLGLRSQAGLLETLYEENPVRCLCCAAPIAFKVRGINKFCNRSCAATYNNPYKHGTPKRVRVAKQRHPRGETVSTIRDVVDSQSVVRYQCRHCTNNLDNPKSLFCGAQCSLTYKLDTRIGKWLANSAQPISNRALRGILGTLRGECCSTCGIENWQEMPIVFEVEHVDGNSDNNLPSNVCLICPNCHSQTSTYKGKNRGNGRHARRERYAAGLSY